MMPNRWSGKRWSYLARSCGLGLGIALLLAPGGDAQASEMLEKLSCVYLSIENAVADGGEVGVTPSLLLAALKVGVTENLPLLAINDSCSADLYLNVGVVPTGSSSGRDQEYTAVVRLELRRMARILENKTEGMVTVWDASTILVGRGNASVLIAETIRDLAAEFGTSTREAARP